jgi:transposase
MWIPPEEKKPIVLHNPKSGKVSYFGAVRLRDGKFVYENTNVFNADTFWNFLKKLKRISCPKGRKVIIVLDNAKYHHALLHKEWRENNNKDFALLYLPPYSPELNPIERVWKLTRRLCTHNRYFENLKQVSDAVEKTLGIWKKPNETLSKLCAIT